MEWIRLFYHSFLAFYFPAKAHFSNNEAIEEVEFRQTRCSGNGPSSVMTLLTLAAAGLALSVFMFFFLENFISQLFIS